MINLPNIKHFAEPLQKVKQNAALLNYKNI